jgi:hypothetical protein
MKSAHPVKTLRSFRSRSASRYQLKSLRYSVARGTGGEFGPEIVQYKPSSHLHRRNFAGAMKLPGKGTASDGIAKEKAFVQLQVARAPWPATARKSREQRRHLRMEALAPPQSSVARLAHRQTQATSARHSVSMAAHRRWRAPSCSAACSGYQFPMAPIAVPPAGCWACRRFSRDGRSVGPPRRSGHCRRSAAEDQPPTHRCRHA